MDRNRDRELLVEYACWADDIRNVLKLDTLMARVRAFMESPEYAEFVSEIETGEVDHG